MANQVYHELYYHAVWSTKYRQQLINRKWWGWLCDQLIVIASKRFANVLAAGVVGDHVHLLMALPPTVQLSDVIGQIKGASSCAYNQLPDIGEKLAWQSGYGLMTVHKGDLERVAKYVHNQPAHHARGIVNADLENDGSTV